MISHKNKPVDNHTTFNALKKKHSEFQRFIPHSEKGTISYFNCACLTKESKCNDYDNRPALCHQYPLSRFLHDHSLERNCGYKIQQRPFYPKIKNERLRILVKQVCELNQLKWNYG
ncbi:MAG: hypothetical protein HRT90_01660 [Candidatus Margulisbacteria bacterium]|nr:hypothetical protein [Candidatus Margulisiibacteriota bacterium]